VEADARMRGATEAELFCWMNGRSGILGEAACSEVMRRGSYLQLAQALASGVFTRAEGRLRSANIFVRRRDIALIGFDALLASFAAERVGEVATNTLLVLVVCRHRQRDVLAAIEVARMRFLDSETLSELDGAERAIRTGRIREFASYVPNESFGWG